MMSRIPSLLLSILLPSVLAVPAGADIYQAIIEKDDNKLSVTRRAADDSWEDPTADIRLDEQSLATSSTGDASPRPLFAHVDEAALSKPTFQAFQKLLDNFIPLVAAPEDEPDAELQEIDVFLDAVIDTRPIQEALRYVRDDLQLVADQTKFRGELRSMWFELYTNHFGGNAVPFNTGFEHVFVGEAKYNRDTPGSIGTIGGYHNWIKFHTDEQIGLVNYLGYNYGNAAVGNEGIANPHFATLRMMWEILEAGDGDDRAFLVAKDPRGGFFVGLSPECELALGTVAFYESKAGRFGSGDKKSVRILGADVELTLHRNVTTTGQRGDFIRSFWPRYLGNVDGGHVVPGDSQTPTVDVLVNNGPIQIAAALVNPAAEPEDGHEWVELVNASDEDISLDGWVLRDHAKRAEPLDGMIDAGATKRAVVSRSSPNSMQLRNSGGKIEVVDDEGAVVAEVTYGRNGQDDVIRFDR